MIYLKTKISDTKPAIIKQITGSLKNSEIIVLPTDTIYGLSCLADDVSAIRRIYKLKIRDPKKPLLILVSSLQMAKKYVFISRHQAEILKKIWMPAMRPTTVILKHRHLLPKELTGISEGLALRLPKSKFLIKILKTIKTPLVSTSFNLSGRPDIVDLKNLGTYSFGHHRPDLVIDGGKSRSHRPSRLIDLRDENNPIVLRK